MLLEEGKQLFWEVLVKGLVADVSDVHFLADDHPNREDYHVFQFEVGNYLHEGDVLEQLELADAEHLLEEGVEARTVVDVFLGIDEEGLLGAAYDASAFAFGLQLALPCFFFDLFGLGDEVWREVGSKASLVVDCLLFWFFVGNGLFFDVGVVFCEDDALGLMGFLLVVKEPVIEVLLFLWSDLLLLLGWGLLLVVDRLWFLLIWLLLLLLFWHDLIVFRVRIGLVV